MSLGTVTAVTSVTPDPIKRLAAAVLALAVDDLGTKHYRQDAAKFLYSGDCEVVAGVLGIDYMHFWNRLQKHQAADTK